MSGFYEEPVFHVAEDLHEDSRKKDFRKNLKERLETKPRLLLRFKIDENNRWKCLFLSQTSLIEFIAAYKRNLIHKDPLISPIILLKISGSILHSS